MSDERRWYVIQTYSGYEDSVMLDLKRRIESMDMQELIFNVLVPERIEKGENGKKDKKVKIYPGYVFVELSVTEESWFIVRNTPKVTGFLGSSGGGTKPVPLREDEILPILRHCNIAEKMGVNFTEGENVEIIRGPFEGQICKVDEVNEEKNTLTVLVDMFNRKTPSEINMMDVKKI